MRLILDREDLKPEYRDISCSQTRFYHFQTNAKAAILVVGEAQFREYDGSNYNTIYLTENTDGGKCARHPTFGKDIDGIHYTCGCLIP